MSVGRGLIPEAYCGGAFLIAAVHSVSFKVNGKANGCKDSANRIQSSLLELLRCSLSYAKIVQTESRISSLLEYYAEVQPILCKVKQINWNSPT